MANEIVVNNWLDEREARDYLGVSRSTLRRLVAEGTLPSYRPRGKRVKRYKRNDLNNLMIAQEVVPPAEMEWDGLECGVSRPKFPPAELEN